MRRRFRFAPLDASRELASVTSKAFRSKNCLFGFQFYLELYLPSTELITAGKRQQAIMVLGADTEQIIRTGTKQNDTRSGPVTEKMIPNVI